MTLTSLMSLATTVLKHSLSAHLMQVKLLVFTFYLNGKLDALHGCQIFGRFGF